MLADGELIPDDEGVAAATERPDARAGLWQSDSEWTALLMQTAAVVTTFALFAAPFMYWILREIGYVTDWRQVCLPSLLVGAILAVSVGKRLYIGQRGRCRIVLWEELGSLEAQDTLVREAAMRAGCPLEEAEGTAGTRQWRLAGATRAAKSSTAEAMNAGIRVNADAGRPNAPPSLSVETWGRANQAAHARFKGAVLEILAQRARAALEAREATKPGAGSQDPQGDPSAAAATARSLETGDGPATTSDTAGA
jgi:hypothetical protein